MAAVARVGSAVGGASDSSSFNITISGSLVVGFVVYDNGKTLTASTLKGVSGTVHQTANLSSEGYKLSIVSYIGSFSGSQPVTYTWTGGTPTNIRSTFQGYTAGAVNTSNSIVGTGGSLSVTPSKTGCWIVGGWIGPVAATGYPTSGTNNNAGIIGGGTSNGLCRQEAGDSNGTVAQSAQNFTTGVTGGYQFAGVAIVIEPTVDITPTRQPIIRQAVNRSYRY